MWVENDFKIFELYERGNHNSRLDVQNCLEQYSDKFKWPAKNARVLEVGSGEGSVTEVLFKWIPSDGELIGSDINEKIVQYANLKHSNERMKFISFDLVGEVPDDMKGQFDHVFAFYVLHWIRDHEKAFSNIYEILPKQGEFFAIFLARSDIYSIFQILSKRSKWAQWMEKIDKFSSMYHDYQDPDIDVSNTLKKVGFEVLDVRCKQRLFVHDIDVFKGLMAGINCFDIPKHMWSEFVDDIMEVKRYMDLVDESNQTVKTNYNLIVLYCRK